MRTNILIVVQNSSDANRLLPKVAELTDAAAAARLHAVRVAFDGLAELEVPHDGAPNELQEFILEQERKALAESLAAAGTPFAGSAETTWGDRLWAAVLTYAESVDADLIVKSATEDADSHLLRTPDDWNLLRNARVPVLLCGDETWTTAPRVIAAVDVRDDEHAALNIRILREARSVCEQLNGRLHVLTAYPPLGPWAVGLNSFMRYQQKMDELRQSTEDRLQTLIEAQGLTGHTAAALEGTAEQVLQKEIEEQHAEILVMGTTARTGVEGIVIGNTAEKLLYDADIDVLTIP